MSFYKYKALTKEGKVVTGSTSASTEGELEAKLKLSNLDLVTSKVVRTSFLTKALNTVSNREIILMCIHFYQLEKAGVPLLDSIGDLRDTADNPIVKEIMMDVYDGLRGGKSLSQALAEHPKVFDEVFIGLIKAGEKTGSFVEVFGHLERHFKWIEGIRKKVKKAVSYPIFLLILMSVVIGLMMTFVIPKLSAFLLSQNIPLPLYSKALIASSDYMVNYWHLFLIIPIGIFIFFKVIRVLSRKIALGLDSIKLKMPVIGPIIKKLEISRFCHFLAITYRSGIGILECLDTAQNVVKNLVIKDAINQIRQDISEGKKITEAVVYTNQFPMLVVRMFKVGEDSGNLDQALENITGFYDEEVNTSIDNLVGVLQPALTILMGGLMFWITISVFGPIYSNFDNLGGGGAKTPTVPR